MSFFMFEVVSYYLLRGEWWKVQRLRALAASFFSLC